MNRLETEFYFQRFGFCERQIAVPPLPALGLIVVIPCFNEPDLAGSLQALWDCARPEDAVEVIVVINASAKHGAEIQACNQKSFQDATEWVTGHPDPQFAVHLLHFPDLPPKHAGVGLARKIGMDEAVRRFDDIGKPDGVIVCFDADCRCERNYLQSIERHFAEHSRSPACGIYFEHPLEGPLDAKVYEAIALYELHLRYYIQALRYAGFPHAYHTIGSSMAVRAEAYVKQGGMNKRQAGEDFYFLQKIIPLGGFADVTDTKVIPSPRPSDRVPFGTGKAVGDFLQEQWMGTYPLEAFQDLRKFFEQLPEWYRSKNFSASAQSDVLPESIRSFLAKEHFAQAAEEICANTSSEAAFRKRFFHWFNGFQAMKFVHHARDQFYGEQSIEAEAKKLLTFLSGNVLPAPKISSRELLEIYRALDRRTVRTDGAAR